MTGEENNFQVGQKVRLNTGGPEMSVENIKGHTCVCRWFVNGVAKTDKFVDQCLVVVAKTPIIIHGKRRALVANHS